MGNYTGSNGFYAQVKLANAEQLAAFFNRLQYALDMSDLHCTIMYSLSALQIDPDRAQAEANAHAQDLHEAVITGFDFWEGHDGAGYFVACLDCESLKTRHRVWRHMGAKPTYEEYTPHITLVKGQDAYRYANRLTSFNKACGGHINVTLSRETIADLSQ